MSKQTRTYKPRAKKAVASQQPIVIYSRAPVKRKAAPRKKASRSATQIVSDGPSFGRTALRTGLGGLGTYLGGPVGTALGMAGADLVSNIVGFGDYKVSENVFLSGNLPQIENIGRGEGNRIRFQEYIGDVISSSSANTFKLDSYPINPGQSKTFQWLSQIAPNYTEWTAEGIVFAFKSTSGDALNSVNTALGTIVMATNYDSTQPDFSSKSEMFNYEYSSQCKPSHDVMHMIECKRSQTVLNELYVRPNATIAAATNDIRFYDLGKFQIASDGCQGTSVKLGQLWVTYQIVLRKQRMFDSLGMNILYTKFHSNTSVAAATPFGTAGATIVDDEDSVNLFVDQTATTLTLPTSNSIQTFQMQFAWSGSAAAIVMPVFTFTNATEVVDIIPYPQAGLAGQTQALKIKFFKTLGDGTQPVITAGVAGTAPAGTPVMYCTIMQVPNGVNGL